MTIAITIKVNDGVVLASDSATTLFVAPGQVYNQYYNADKLFNLKKRYPIGALTWGAGNIGVASISTLVKDFRKQLEIEDGYTIEGIAQQLRSFLIKAQSEAYSGLDLEQLPMVGIRVAGYSADAPLAEECEFVVGTGDEGASPVEVNQPQEKVGITWSGEPEAVQRLVIGFSPSIALTLHELEVPDDEIPQLMEAIRQKTEVHIVTPAMPIADAIDLADFVVTLAAKFSRFKPGYQTVGGPTDIAAITKHEGFKWIKRKHHYPQELNPGPLERDS